MSRVILIVYLFILYGLIHRSGLSQKVKNKRFIILASIGFIIDSGFRHLCIGPDTYQYYLMFEEAKDYSFLELFDSTFRIGNYTSIKDAGYWLFQKGFQFLFPSFRLFLIFIAVLFFTALGRLLYRYLDDEKSILISYLFYIGMFWYFFSTTGCRQTIAVSLLILAFPILEKGEYIKYSLVVVLSAFFHASAIVALLGLAVLAIRSKWFYFGLVFILIPIVFAARYQLFGFLIERMEMEDVYGVYLETKEAATSISVTLLYLFTLVLCIIYRERLSANKGIDYCSKLFFIGMCFLPTMFIAATAMRVTFYFTYTMYILVPFILKQIKLSNKYGIAIVIMLFLSFFSIRQTWDYKFFWENGRVTSYGHSFMVKEDLPF